MIEVLYLQAIYYFPSCYSLQDFYKFYQVTGLKWKVSLFTWVISS